MAIDMIDLGNLAARLNDFVGKRGINKWKHNERILILLAVLGLIVAICACIAAWLVVPQIQQVLSTPQSATPIPSNTPHTISFPNPTSTSEKTPILTREISPEPTPTPETVILFDDDFENGLSKWTVGEGWEIRQDEKGNHFACAKLTGTKYSFIIPRVSEIWQDYWLNLDVMAVDPLSESALSIDVHRDEKPKVRAYQLQLSEKKMNLSKYYPDSKKYVYLTSSEQQPSLAPQTWYPIQIEVGFGNFIKY